MRATALMVMLIVGGCGSSDADQGAAADAGNAALALQQSSIIFYDLPINSIRYAVSGFEPQNNVCVTLVWSIAEPGPSYELCGIGGIGGAPEAPYAIVAPPTPPADPSDGPLYGLRQCEVWDYGPNATVEALEGCVTFQGSPTIGSADLVVTLSGDLLNGDLEIRSE